jgi:hypothetical protein
VELRLRGRDPEFVVTSSPTVGAPEPPAGADEDAAASALGPMARGDLAGDEGGMSRINLRMPDHLKGRVDQAAAAAGLSVNAWLVRAAAAGVGRAAPPPRTGRPQPRGQQRVTGWARS